MPPHFLDGEPHATIPTGHGGSVGRANRCASGSAGPVGSGKTALVAALCRQLRDELRWPC